MQSRGFLEIKSSWVGEQGAMMAGTKKGGAQAASTNKKRYGADFYARIGAKGGKKGRTGGFYANRELAREAGRKGGLKSRRGSTGRISRPIA